MNMVADYYRSSLNIYANVSSYTQLVSVTVETRKLVT